MATVQNVISSGISLRILAVAVALGFLPEAMAQGPASTIQLEMPIGCELGRTCHIQNYVDVDSSASAQDYKCGTLTYDRHNGTDFRLSTLALQKAGVDVLAAAGGRVLRTRDGAPDAALGKSAPEAVRDVECGNGVVIAHPDSWETQYCHMASGSLKVKPGDVVKAGQPLGRVGLSGMTEYPHLHFTVRHKGEIADPFAYKDGPAACGSGTLLWNPALHVQLAYHERAVMNAGFASGPVTMEVVEDGSAGKELPSADAAALVAFVRVIGLKAGDTQRLVVHDPGGKVIAESKAGELDKNKAQYLIFAGRKRPETGWNRGTYKAMYVVERDGRVVLQQPLEFTL